MELKEIAETLVSSLSKAIKIVLGTSEKDLIEAIPTTVANQTRYDDDVTAGDINELTTFLNDPGNQRQYQNMQNREANESEMYSKRQRELALLYLFQTKTIQGKTNEFWANEYSNSVWSDSALNRGVGEDGDIVDYDEFAQGAGKGGSTEYMNDDARDAASRYREQKGNRKDTLYKTQSQSIGATGTAVTINFTKVQPAKGSSTDNLMEKLIDELKGDRSATLVLMAILVKWRIELDTFIPSAKVPKEWGMVNKFIESAEDDAVGNLRKVVEEFGIKNLRSSSPEIQAIQSALLRVTDSKDANELAELFNSEVNESKEAYEELLEIFEASPKVKRVKPSARMGKLIKKLEDGILKGKLTLTASEWCQLLPMLVNDNADRSSKAYKDAFNFSKKRTSKIRTPQDVVTVLATMFQEDPKDLKLAKVVSDLVMSPINESVAVEKFFSMINEAATSDDDLMPL